MYSFNLDELSDAGAEQLKAMELDWTPMRLPGGRNNQVYRVYAAGDPIGIRVNAHGHAHLSTSRLRKLSDETPMEENIDDPRYLAQLQSLLVGDWALPKSDIPNLRSPAIPAETVERIEACFVAPPHRYRLTHAEAFSNYEQAEALCRQVMVQHPDVSDLWVVRDYRIIALMGMWKTAMDPKYLEAAAEEARHASAEPRLVPLFCLAREALRQGSNPEDIIPGFIHTLGANDASSMVHAAAAILAIEANARELHLAHRERVLERHADDPALWPVVSFLRDQNHSYRLFKPNFYHPPSMARRAERSRLRSNAAALDRPMQPGAPLQTEFKTLQGEPWKLPSKASDSLTLLMFVEPPADPRTNFPRGD